MLDKSVPYIEFWMMRENPLPLPEIKLPVGYNFTHYLTGDDVDWCEIETSVGEFASIDEAHNYFERTFAPHPEELTKRMFFITNSNGQKVATGTAWWSKENQPLFHWLAVKPEAQGLGLGKAMTIKVTQRLEEFYPETQLRLHTQTWSHRAVGIYEKLGYEIVNDGVEAEKAVEIIKVLRNN